MDPVVVVVDELPPQYETSPSPSDQYDIIQPLVNLPLQIGETRYLIDYKWYEQWRQFTTQKSSNSPGPIDNTSLFNDGSFTTLREWLSIDIDVVPVPEEAWEKLILWYGSLTPEIVRPIIKSSGQEAIIEVYPWEVSLVRILRPASSMLSKKAPKLRISKGCTISDLRFKVIELLEIEKEMKLWKFGENVPETPFIKADQLESAQPIETKFDGKTIQEFGLHLYDAIGVEIKEDGKWPTGYVAQPVVASPNGLSNNTPVFSISPAYTPKTTVQSSKPHGVTGLSNLGNTCFMNSALQCLSNTKELKEYFFSGMYKHELNKTNPLGMNGEVAEAFGSLIERLWNGLNSSIAPREFKLTIGRFAPSFMGYQQHDSQEFIAFLLDGLHEDLNRIYDKPYIEKKDSEGRPDALVAKEHWEIHKSRNDSVIVDMFQGQYKSTLICPECNKVSVTFDPFMYLTLPIPVSKDLKLEVHFVPLDPSKRPLKLNLKMTHGGTHRAMKEKIGSLLSVNPDNLVSCEVYTSRIYKVFENSDKLNEIGISDTIYVYELAVAFPPNRGSGYVILSVLNAYSKQASTSSFGTSRNIPDFFGVPLIVTLSEDKISEDGLEEAVVEQLGRYTTIDLKFLTPAEFTSTKREELANDVEMDDVEVNHQRIEEINDEELTAKEEEIAPLEECSLETPVKKFKKADPKLFEMKISSQASGRSIPANFTLTNIITLGKRRQDVDEAKEVTSLPFLKLGDTIICEWEREVADYVFDNTKNEMDTDDNRRGLWSTFEIFQDPNESPIEKSQEKKDITLDDCLEEFVKEEQLGEDDPWYCPNCKKHQQALKKFDLWRLPDFLVVHLKRFSHTRSWRNKIDVLIDFPVSDLDLSPRVLSESSETNGMVYDLYAISNHYGGLGGGHYTAYAYNYEEERWYHYDDSMVEPVDVESIKTTAAYLLFYKRRGAEIHLPDLSKIEQQNEQLPANGQTDQMQLTPFNPSLGNSDHIEYSDEELDKDMEISMSDSRSSPDFM